MKIELSLRKPSLIFFIMEIYNYNLGVYEQYARNQHDIDQFRKDFPGIFTPTRIIDTVSKPPNLVLLFQTNQKIAWADFEVPPRYKDQRDLSPYITPSIGSEEKNEADIRRIEGFVSAKVNKNTEDEANGKSLVALLTEIKTTNAEIDFVNARRNQYAKG